MTMQESEFWHRLEYRLCDELSGLPECSARGLWCDGVIPEHYSLDSKEPQIQGRAWMGWTGKGGSSEQEQWTFVLALGAGNRAIERVEWDSLLPKPDAHGWLIVDLDRKHLDISRP